MLGLTARPHGSRISTLGLALGLLLAPATPSQAAFGLPSMSSMASGLWDTLSNRDTWITLGGAAAGALAGAALLPATSSVIGGAAAYSALAGLGGLATRLIGDWLGFTNKPLFGGKSPEPPPARTRPALPTYARPPLQITPPTPVRTAGTGFGTGPDLFGQGPVTSVGGDLAVPADPGLAAKPVAAPAGDTIQTASTVTPGTCSVMNALGDLGKLFENRFGSHPSSSSPAGDVHRPTPIVVVLVPDAGILGLD